MHELLLAAHMAAGWMRMCFQQLLRLDRLQELQHVSRRKCPDTSCIGKLIGFTLLYMQVIPILRAGLVLLEQAATLLPASETYHLGYVRDDDTLQVRGSSSNNSKPKQQSTGRTVTGCGSNCVRGCWCSLCRLPALLIICPAVMECCVLQCLETRHRCQAEMQEKV